MQNCYLIILILVRINLLHVLSKDISRELLGEGHSALLLFYECSIRIFHNNMTVLMECLTTLL